MGPLDAFIIYSKSDEEFRKKLLDHLHALARKGKIRTWSDPQLRPGEVWETAILEQLKKSSLIFYLVSSYSIKNTFIDEVEIPIALNLQKSGRARLIPIIVRQCLWEEVPYIERVQALPMLPGIGLKPVSAWSDQDEAWVAVVRKINIIVEDLLLWREINSTPAITFEKYKQYLAQFPDGYYADFAQKKKQEIIETAWRKAMNSPDQLNVFKNRFKNESYYVTKAENQIARLLSQQEQDEFNLAMSLGTFTALNGFKNKYPKSERIPEINKKTETVREEEKLNWEKVQHSKKSQDVRNFINKYRDGYYAKYAINLEKHLAVMEVEENAWTLAVQTNTIPVLIKYLATYPQGMHRTEAQQRIDAIYQNEPAEWMNAEQKAAVLSSIREKLNIYDTFLTLFPNGKYKNQALFKKLDLSNTLDNNTWGKKRKATLVWDSYFYLKKFPYGNHAGEARKVLRNFKRGAIALAILLLLMVGKCTWTWFTTTKSGIDPNNFVLVQGGLFKMGKNNSENILNDECEHIDTTVGDFRISKYELTWGDLEKIYGDDFNPPEDVAAENITVKLADDILKLLNDKYPERHYRLPTEAEWEFAANGGRRPSNYLFSGGREVSKFGWHKGNSNNTVHEVGMRLPNSLQLYDMTGNVLELCSTPYVAYPKCWSSPICLNKRVWRGGNYDRDSAKCTITFRACPDKAKGCGLRLVLEE